MKDNAAIVDVDGSYLYKKRLRLEASGFVLALMTPPTSAPLSGWDVVTEANATTVAQKLPCVTVGMVYSYLDSHTGRERGHCVVDTLCRGHCVVDTLCRGYTVSWALCRGYTHLALSCVERIEVNCENPLYCHVQSVMKPSTRQGSYRILLMLRYNGPYATMSHVTCKCAAV